MGTKPTKQQDPLLITHISDECKKASNFMRELTQFMGEYPDTWDPFMEKDVQEQSNGRVRVIEAFFASPDDLCIENLHLHALSERELHDLWPEFVDKAKTINRTNFLFLFMCNGVFEDNQAFAGYCVFE